MSKVQVQFTNDYSLFKVMGANRMVNKGHVQQLINSIEERPNAIKYSPILVNEAMFVIDGQHRLEALKTLNMPVHFIVGEGLTIDDARLMNATMQNWSPMDFARSYAEGGNKNYQDYIYARKKFKTNHTITAHYLANNLNSRTTSSYFRRGEFKVDDLELGLERLETLIELQKLSPVGQYRDFGIAFLKVLDNPDVDMQRFFNKFKAVGTQFLSSPQPTMHGYLRAFESIYNHNFALQNQARLF